MPTKFNVIRTFQGCVSPDFDVNILRYMHLKIVLPMNPTRGQDGFTIPRA